MGYYFLRYYRQIIFLIAAILLCVQLFRLILKRRLRMSFLEKLRSYRPFFQKTALNLFLVVLLIAGVLLVPSMARLHSVRTLSLNYSNAYQGLNPNGTRFNQSSILNEEILSSAIKKGAFEGVSVKDLEKTLRITPLVEGSSDSEEDYHISTQYMLEYEGSAATAGIDGDLITQLTLEAYKEWFINEFSLNTSLLEVGFEDIRQLDYLDIYRYIYWKTGDIGQYMLTMSSTNPNFSSEMTGESFSTLASAAYSIRDVMAENLYAYILENGISKEKGIYLGRLSFENMNLGFDAEKERLSNINNLEAIDMYENDISTAVLVPTYDENAQYYMSRTRIGVDDLASSAEEHANQMTSIRSQIANNLHVASMLADITPGAENIATADELIDQIETELDRVIDNIIVTIREYNESITNQYMDISEVSEVSSWMSSLKDVLIWWVGIAVLLHVCAALKEYEKEGESR